MGMYFAVLAMLPSPDGMGHIILSYTSSYPYIRHYANQSNYLKL